ncbi:MAG TPA: beta-ketoacyl-ACP synthase II, partial [Coxiellaceae bacterium]|nr:beta-ketoacyl-ACP synthase II [Coxiellaceae bacterium]
MKRRVVITGLGAVTPLGTTVPITWDAILKGKSGVRRIDWFETSDLSTKICGPVLNFDPEIAMTLKDTKRFDRFVHLAMAAAQEAINDSQLNLETLDGDRAGVAVGSGMGGLPLIAKCHEALLEGGPRKISPFFIPGGIINMASGLIASKFKFRGPNISIVTACTTGTHNVGYAMRMIQYGDADVVLAGGTESSSSRLGLGGFAAARALSTRNDEPEKASRPFDRDRDGFVMAEGAAVLQLEELEYAKARGARIYAELVGFGMSDDAYHITLPDPDARGAAMCMKNALKDAHLQPEQVDYINAHGTSTEANDPTETHAIKKAFHGHAYKVAISSTKSMTGHMLGAAGSVEAIFSILAIRDQIAPPTINLDNPDERCDL